MAHHTHEKTARLSFIYRIFCWCSGARLYLLQRCPSEYNKFFGMGIIVFMTGIMASISGGYALFTVFKSLPLALAFGLLWGTMIFFLDWYIVSSLKKEGRLGRELLFALPRLVLAIFLAIVISIPLKLKLFEREINQELTTVQAEKSSAYKGMVDKEFSEIQEIKTESEQLKKQLAEKEATRNRLFDLFIAEAEGKSPTGVAGKGPVYREKKQQYDKVDRELNQLKSRYLEQIEQNNKRISELQASRQQRISQASVVTQNYDGFLARLSAMNRLTRQNDSVRWASLFIILLFVCIEASPILVKLMAKRGPYDQMLDAEEYSSLIESEKWRFDTDMFASRYWQAETDKHELASEARMRSDQQFIANITEAQHEVNKRKVEKWKEQALDEVESNTTLHVDTIENLLKHPDDKVN